jgi:hypothetical protein
MQPIHRLTLPLLFGLAVLGADEYWLLVQRAYLPLVQTNHP